MKSLILYFSSTGNTRSIAEKIYTNTFSNIEELYIKNNKLKPLKSNIDNYHTIFIGGPIINLKICEALAMLFTEYDFTNKRIIPFISYDYRGYSDLKSDLVDKCINIEINNLLTVYYDDVDKNDLIDWISKIKV